MNVFRKVSREAFEYVRLCIKSVQDICCARDAPRIATVHAVVSKLRHCSSLKHMPGMSCLLL